MDYPTITYVEPLSEHRLFIIFSDQTIKIYPLQKLLGQYPAFQTLQDDERFRSVKIAAGGYGLIWNDQLDVSESELWENGVFITTTEQLAGPQLIHYTLQI